MRDGQSAKTAEEALPKTPLSSELFMGSFFNEEQNSDEYNHDLAIINKQKEVDLEIVKFTALIKMPSFCNSPISVKEFWIKHEDELPNLFKLAIILLNIQSSSSSVERFFSICG
jgi:hypothetical protein